MFCDTEQVGMISDPEGTGDPKKWKNVSRINIFYV